MDKEKPETKNQFKLMYVGQQLYNTEIFEREAKHLGVNRAIAFQFLKGLKWGDHILLARYIRTALKKEKEKKPLLGQAEVFGYFTLSGISHTMSHELSQELQNQLKIIKIDDKSKNISRACGSYNVGAVAYIADTLEELLDKIRKLSGGGEFGVNSYKWFVTGKYTSLQPFILDPALFTRGLQTVTVENLNLSLQQNESASLVWLYNYKRRGYMNKLMKQRFQIATKNKFVDSF